MFKEILKKYFNSCFARNLQANTIESYNYTLNYFFDFLENQRINKLEEIDSDVVNQFLKLKSKEVSKTTIRNYYVTLRAFFNFLYKKKYINDNPFNYLQEPKIPKRKKTIFKNSEIQKLMEFDLNNFFGMRNYCIMAFLFSTGLRVSELCNLKLNNIDFDIDLIDIIGKGDKQRYVPLNELLKSIIIKYIKNRNEYLTEHNLKSNYLFISRTGKKLNPVNVQDIFRKIKEKHKIDKKRFSPHTFRHTFATDFLMNGGDVFSLQKILGHSNLETTKEYIGMDEKLVKIQNEKYNPFTNKKWIYAE